MDLFGEESKNKKAPSKESSKDSVPLAERMRPENLDDFLGQAEIAGKGKILRTLIEKDDIPSMIFWGPPGTGKTTLARIIAKMTKSVFVQISATGGSVKDIREIVQNAKKRIEFNGQKTILFVDEIHRFNKAQQDAFLPYVEDGTIILIGATTENPSFEVNSALLSRCRVFVFKALDVPEIAKILNRALKDKDKGLGKFEIKIEPETINFLASMANSDARISLNALELAVKFAKKGGGAVKIDGEAIKQSLQKTHLLYDRAGEEHYNIISALHKSMRGNDVDASLYWLGRMLEAGEDPLFVARRLVRFASEDIGLADPNALPQAVAAYQACHFNGMPECNVNLAQAAAYLARAPKSNALYVAYQRVQKDIKDLPAYPVPLHIRNAPTELMKNIGYGKGYKYNPNFKGIVEQDYLPDELKNRKYFIDKVIGGKSSKDNLPAEKIGGPEIILASSSPTRAEIMKRMGLDFKVAASDFDERAVNIKDTLELVKALAMEKAKTVAKKYPGAIIIGADTMVEFQGRQIGKGENAEETRKILEFLRGSVHRIVTGVAVIDTSAGKAKCAASETKVFMKNYSDKDMDEYIATGEPIGKAGGYYKYGVHSGMVIDKIEGEESTVAGLSIAVLSKLLSEFGINLPKSPKNVKI